MESTKRLQWVNALSESNLADLARKSEAET
jgi:hypothetical protein